MVIKAVIFDMDGLLIDSEPLWQEAEIKVFKQVNINLTPALCEKTKGMRIDSVVNYWHSKYPWKTPSKKVIEKKIMKEVISLVKNKGKPMKGVMDVFDFVRRKDVKVALASSSQMILINEVIKKFNLEKYFDVIYSAEFEEYGKPHPGVYLTTAKKLKVNPFECVAVEDSFNGVLAAKSASMKCVCVPDNNDINLKKLVIADEIIDSLSDFDDKIWMRLNN